MIYIATRRLFKWLILKGVLSSCILTTYAGHLRSFKFHRKTRIVHYYVFASILPCCIPSKPFLILDSREPWILPRRTRSKKNKSHIYTKQLKVSLSDRSLEPYSWKAVRILVINVPFYLNCSAFSSLIGKLESHWPTSLHHINCLSRIYWNSHLLTTLN